jgi:hypothetical protein
VVVQEETECGVVDTVLIAAKAFVQYVQVTRRERGAYCVCRDGGTVMVRKEIQARLCGDYTGEERTRWWWY